MSTNLTVDPKQPVNIEVKDLTLIRYIKAIAVVFFLTFAVISASTMIDFPADVKVKKTFFGNIKVFAASKGRDLPNVVNQISVMRLGVHEQPFRRDNMLCECASTCTVTGIHLTMEINLIGRWDGRLDNCEKAPRGEYSISVIGPVDKDGRVLPVVYGIETISVDY